MWRATAGLLIWTMGHWLSLVELLLSTAVHVTYAAFIITCALLTDFLALPAHPSRQGRGGGGAPPPLAGEPGGKQRRPRRDSEVPTAVEEEAAELAHVHAPACGIAGNTIPVLRGAAPSGSAPVSQNHHHHHSSSKQPGGARAGGKSPLSLAPIVLVHGIFGFGHGRLGGMSYFGGAELKDDRVLVPDLGSLSSYHDRACELFYYLKGGTVDFGVEHSRQCGHDRFGKTYEKGHHAEWSERHPIHFVGHSSGVQVVRLLQNMLSEKSFPGHEDSSEDWVASITSLSGALNGTTRVYMDGLSPRDGRTMQAVSLLQVLRVGTLLYEWLDVAWLKRYYGFGFDHFPMSWRKGGVRGLLAGLLNRAGPFASGDWILPDLSIESTLQLNARLKTFRNTYYFSYATVKTRRILGRTMPADWTIHPLFLIRALQMSQWRHPAHLPLPYEGYRDEDWQDNDGALNTISMLYPRLPEVHPHRPLGADPKGHKFLPGVWYYTLLDADHITFIISRRRAGIHFDVLYDSIFQRCRRHLERATIAVA